MSTDKVQRFIATLSEPLSNFGNSADAKAHALCAFFCNNSATDPSIPGVGLVDEGPNFLQQSGVFDLFKQMFVSFPGLTYEIHGGILKDDPNLNFSLQGLIKTGFHVEAWFQKPNNRKSRPLSDITKPAGNLQSQLPACSVFTFDQMDNITRLSIYFDRWRMALALGWKDPGPTP